MNEQPIMIPADPEARARLANFAGLTDEERHALDQWCYLEEQKRARGVLLHECESRVAGHLVGPPEEAPECDPQCHGRDDCTVATTCLAKRKEAGQ